MVRHWVAGSATFTCASQWERTGRQSVCAALGANALGRVACSFHALLIKATYRMINHRPGIKRNPNALTSSAARMPTQIMSWLMEPSVPRRWVGEICGGGPKKAREQGREQVSRGGGTQGTR